MLQAFACLFLLLASLAVRAEPAPALAARAWTLLDATSATALAAHAAQERQEPGPLAQLMTAYVVFTALGEGRTRPDSEVRVSAAALAAPGRTGSRMYIEPGRAVTVDQLLQGLIVASADDAAIALAEHVSGTAAAFVDRMNAEAGRLRLTNTHFANPTGASDPQNYSTAEDLARLAQRLLADFPQLASRFAAREVTYNNVTQANRNRLLWSDASVDGLKSGQTESGGWSMVATAARPQGSGERAFARRLIAVVLGTPSDSARVQETLRLLNYGFSAFDTVRLYRQGDLLLQAEVWKGDRDAVPIGVERDVFVTVPSEALRGLGQEALRSSIERNDPLIAPLSKGEMVGRLKISAGGDVLADVPVVVLQAVAEAGLVGRAYDAVRLWWRRRN